MRENLNVKRGNTANSYKEIKHTLGFYPDIVSVRTHLGNGYVSDAQGAALESFSSYNMGGVIFGYDHQKIRLWVPTGKCKTNDYIIKQNNKDNMRSSMASGLNPYGGLVYAYTKDSIMFWIPNGEKGHLVYIGGIWGSGQKSESADVVDVNVVVYHLSALSALTTLTLSRHDDTVESNKSKMGNRLNLDLNFYRKCPDALHRWSRESDVMNDGDPDL
ncbi:unnamed protein product [Mytilus coruscus]|uniref:Uncharacterized protein n=1 Tax=Mytilus coruscus TaxID=42192 RepID=A0A6J8DBL1_MYTCO|nr:unnamed protein product [Mytilus coruscus]